MKWFVGYEGLSPHWNPSLSRIMLLAFHVVFVNKNFQFHFRLNEYSEVIKRTSLSEVLKANGRGQGHASSCVGGASLVTSHITPISLIVMTTVFQAIEHFITDKENIPEPHPFSEPHPLLPHLSNNITNQDSSNNSTFYNHLYQDSKDYTSLLAPPIYFNSICKTTPTHQQSHSSLQLDTVHIDNGNYGNTSEHLAVDLPVNRWQKESPLEDNLLLLPTQLQREIVGEMESVSPYPLLNHTPLPDHTPPIDSSLVDLGHIVEDIKGEWLLTQQTEPRVPTPLIDHTHNTSCDTPFWRCIPSTQDILEGKSGCGQATSNNDSSGRGSVTSHSINSSTRPWPHPHCIVTPQLHRTLVKRTLISSSPRPHSLGIPGATSTPRVAMVTGCGKEDIMNNCTLGTSAMTEMSRELFVNGSIDNCDDCMSPDIL